MNGSHKRTSWKSQVRRLRVHVVSPIHVGAARSLGCMHGDAARRALRCVGPGSDHTLLLLVYEQAGQAVSDSSSTAQLSPHCQDTGLPPWLPRCLPPSFSPGTDWPTNRKTPCPGDSLLPPLQGGVCLTYSTQQRALPGAIHVLLWCLGEGERA